MIAYEYFGHLACTELTFGDARERSQAPYVGQSCCVQK